MPNVRTPKQDRSIETRNKIILASYELFAQVGYYNTNTAEIAKHAGVSTGIMYNYFHDKRDLLLEVLDVYIKEAYTPILNAIDNFKKPLDINGLVSNIIDMAVKVHKKYSKIHECLHSMTYIDEKINDKFMSLEKIITLKIKDKLINLGLEVDNMNEKIHMGMNIVQSFAHECTYDNHSYIDYTKMRQVVNKLVIDLFE